MEGKPSSILLNGFREMFPNLYSKATIIKERGYSELVFELPSGERYIYDQLTEDVRKENNRSASDPRSNDEWRKEFSHRLRHAMTRFHWSQADIAKVTGVSQKTVGNWCSGVTMPSIDAAVKIAHFLKIPISDLIDFY